MTSLDDLLGAAYHLDQVEQRRPDGVKLLKDAIAADEALRDEALKRQDSLVLIVQARTLGSFCGAHVEKICLELLNAVLADEEMP